MSGVVASVIRVTVVLGYKVRVWSGFWQVACAIEGVTRGACLLEDSLVVMLSEREGPWRMVCHFPV